MLVLNRRAGEWILVEEGIRLGVLAVGERKAWLAIGVPGVEHPVRVALSALSAGTARLEIGAPISARFDGEDICVEVAGPGHAAVRTQATVAFDRKVAEHVRVGEVLRLGVGPMPKGSPCLTVEGPHIGTGLAITVIRRVGSYVRLGLEAPGRRVYRQELWEEVVAANRAAAAGDDVSVLLATRRAPPLVRAGTARA